MNTHTLSDIENEITTIKEKVIMYSDLMCTNETLILETDNKRYVRVCVDIFVLSVRVIQSFQTCLVYTVQWCHKAIVQLIILLIHNNVCFDFHTHTHTHNNV
jgi:hypothetical protein